MFIFQEMQTKHDEDTDKLTKEKDNLKFEFDKIKAELLGKLTSAEEEVSLPLT